MSYGVDLRATHNERQVHPRKQTLMLCMGYVSDVPRPEVREPLHSLLRRSVISSENSQITIAPYSKCRCGLATVCSQMSEWARSIACQADQTPRLPLKFIAEVN